MFESVSSLSSGEWDGGSCSSASQIRDDTGSDHRCVCGFSLRGGVGVGYDFCTERKRKVTSPKQTQSIVNVNSAVIG